MSFATDSTLGAAPVATRVAQAFAARIADSDAVVRSWVKAVHAAHVRRATFRQLNALDDRTLRDIGLTRDMIHSAVENLELD